MLIFSSQVKNKVYVRTLAAAVVQKGVTAALFRKQVAQLVSSACLQGNGCML